MGYVDEEYLDYLMETQMSESGEWEETAETEEWEEPSRNENRAAPKKRKKRHPFRWLLLIAVIAALAVLIMGKQPVRAGAGERRDGFSTILIAGTDDAGLRTDTLMILSVDSKNRKVNLLSIPRDTYCEGYKTPKINATNAVYGGGEEGMEELMRRISEITGFMPDGYVLVNLDAFVKVVDLFGGVDFDVPIDMDYEDPAQDLYIHLDKGYQHLDGNKSIQLVRFRKGYAQQDLTRVSVQRDFVRAAVDQWARVESVTKIPELMKIIEEDIFTDLTDENIRWIGRCILTADIEEMESHTLPGEAATIKGVSYFVADKEETAGLMAEKFSPYK